MFESARGRVLAPVLFGTAVVLLWEAAVRLGAVEGGRADVFAMTAISLNQMASETEGL